MVLVFLLTVFFAFSHGSCVSPYSLLCFLSDHRLLPLPGTEDSLPDAAPPVVDLPILHLQQQPLLSSPDESYCVSLVMSHPHIQHIFHHNPPESRAASSNIIP